MNHLMKRRAHVACIIDIPREFLHHYNAFASNKVVILPSHVTLFEITQPVKVQYKFSLLLSVPFFPMVRNFIFEDKQGKVQVQ